MPEFKNLNTDAGLVELNKYLETRSYLDGYKPSGADSALLTSISAAVDNKKYPHVGRWLKQITSFTPCQRATWGGAAASSSTPAAAKAAAPAAAAAKPAAKKAADSDDDFGLSSDDEDDAAIQAIADKHNKARQEKAAASGKVKIDKSMLTIFVKPAEDTTDMHEVAKKIKATITFDSLQWGDYKLEPVAYGIMKAKMVCTYEDLKVAPDDVIEAIEEIEEVQSCDLDSVNILA
jgi:elongation factor 1-beta